MKKNKKMFAILTLVAFMMTLVPALAFAATDVSATAEAVSATTVEVTFGDKVTATGSDLKAAFPNSTNAVLESNGRVVTLTFATIPEKVSYEPTTDNYLEKGADTVNAIKDIAVNNNAPVVDTVAVDDTGKVVTVTFDKELKTIPSNGDIVVKINGTAVASSDIVVADSAKPAYTLTMTAATVNAGDTVTIEYSGTSLVSKTDKAVAAFTKTATNNSTVGYVAAGISYSKSRIINDGDDSIKLASSGSKTLDFIMQLRDSGNASNKLVPAGKTLVVWVERNTGIVSDVDTLKGLPSDFTAYGGAYQFSADKNGAKSVSDSTINFSVTSSTSGNIKVVAALVDTEYESGSTVDKSETLKEALKNGYKFTTVANATFKAPSAKGHIGDVTTKGTAEANGVDNITVSGYLYDSSNSEIAKQTITISANKSGLSFPKEVTTNSNGKFEFDVTSTKPGDFKLTLKSSNTENFEKTIQFGTAGAYALTLSDGPADKVKENSDVSIAVIAKDINGNELKDYDSVADSIKVKHYVDGDEQNDDLTAAWSADDVAYVVDVQNLDEGSHKVVVYLPNGKSVTVEFKAVEMGDPVRMSLDYKAENIALGKDSNVPKVKRYDAQDVEETVTSGISFAKTGAAALNSATGQLTKAGVDSNGNIDKDNVGRTINVTAMDDDNDLVASATLTIVGTANALAFPEKATAAVGETASFVFSAVNGQGQVVPVSGLSDADLKYVVTKKPTDAIVTVDVSTKDLAEKGTGIIEFTSNKEGEVEVTVMLGNTCTGVLKVNVGKTASAADSTATLIIGSNTFIANGKVATSDVAPFIQNGRTFLPVRALAEALGATVEFDAATNKVTIKCDDVTAEMTLGSTIMTVNDEVVTMDTAAYATAEGRTVVPVRYAAQALGYELETTTNADGTTATVTLSK